MKYLFYPLILILIVLTFVEFLPVVWYAITHLAVYQWFIYGFVAYFILRRLKFVSQNEELKMTAAHERTHEFVGRLFLRKIHSIEIHENHGAVCHSGGKFGSMFISLSPYCLPIYTYLIIFFRILGANKLLYVFDVFIGLTLAFHIVCFWNQTYPKQSDIQGQGVIRSYLFLIVAWLFNATIILLTIRKGIVGAITYIFPQYWGDIVAVWNYIF